MSEANNNWRIDVDGRTHEVHLEHGTWSGKREVTVEGAVLVDESKWFDTGSSHAFDIGGHTAEVRIQVTHAGFAHASALFVDGSFVEPLRR